MPPVLTAAVVGPVVAAVVAVVVAAVLDLRVCRLARHERGTGVAAHLDRPAGRLVAPLLAAALVLPLAAGAGPLRTVAATALVPALVVGSLVDVRVRRIPDVVTRPATVAGLAVCVAACVRDGSATPALAAAGVGVVALVVAAVWPPALGAGDAKLIVALALLATAWGPGAVVPTSAAGLVLSGLASAWVLVTRRTRPAGTPGRPIAAGPFIAAGAVAALHLLAA